MRLIRKASRADEGVISIVFAFTLLVICLAMGMAIDFLRASSHKNALQSAADSAVLAAGSALIENPSLTNAELVAIATQYMEGNQFAAKFSDAVSTTVDITVAATRITANVHASVPTTLLAISGITDIAVSVVSEADATGLTAEVVFVLEHSSSMSGAEHDAMISATRSLVSQLTGNFVNPDVKIGLVPFAKYVRASLSGEYVLGSTAGTTWTNCSADRRHPYNIQNTLPTSGVPGSLWGRTDGDDTIDADEYDDCDLTTPPSLVVRPLSTAHATTDTNLASMQSGSGTNILAGLQFGWHLLTPNGIWSDAEAHGQIKKYVVLLTDGRHNKKSFGPGGSYTEEDALVNIQSVCSGMKALNITVIAVAYDLSDPEGKQDLQSCVSAGQYYHEAQEASILKVFTNIGGQIMSGQLHLAK